MNIQSIRNFTLFLPLTLGIGACAGTNFDTAEHQATHVWYAKEAKTERDYKLDQAQCSDAHQLDLHKPIVEDSLSFEGYHDCMMAKGYVLRHY